MSLLINCYPVSQILLPSFPEFFRVVKSKSGVALIMAMVVTSILSVGTAFRLWRCRLQGFPIKITTKNSFGETYFHTALTNPLVINLWSHSHLASSLFDVILYHKLYCISMVWYYPSGVLPHHYSFAQNTWLFLKCTCCVQQHLHLQFLFFPTSLPAFRTRQVEKPSECLQSSEINALGVKKR